MALTPAGARELIQRGHEVLVETTAGEGSAFPDEQYERAGARVVSVDDAWGQADLLLKVKEPIEPEYSRLREGLVLFTYLHIAADEPLTRALADSGIAAVAYETVETDDRRLAAARPDERDRGQARAAGRRALPREAARRAGRTSRGDAGCPARPRRRSRRWDRRLQRGDHRPRPRRPRHGPRALDRPDAAPRRDPLRTRQPAHVVEPRDRADDHARRRRDRRRPHPGRARSEADQPRDALRHAARRRHRRRRHRPGRLHRDGAPDDALRSRSTRSTGSSTTASRTCRVACPSPPRRR